MQGNHDRWHVERSSTKKVSRTESGELTTKINELVGI